VIELPREVCSEVKKSQNGKETKTVESSSSLKVTLEKEKTVQIQRSSINTPIPNSEKPKVQTNIQAQSTDDEDFFERKNKVKQISKTDVTKLHQKTKLDISSDEYEEEEEDQ
jgi:hypothetical protein